MGQMCHVVALLVTSEDLCLMPSTDIDIGVRTELDTAHCQVCVVKVTTGLRKQRLMLLSFSLPFTHILIVVLL